MKRTKLRPRLSTLTRQAREWGGDIVKISKDTFHEMESRGYDGGGANTLSQAPFTTYLLGVNRKYKTIYYAEALPACADVATCNFIHEMGHVFATKKSLDDSNEPDFFGWEYLLALDIGLTPLQFLKGNASYVIDNNNRDIGSYLQQGKAGLVELGILIGGFIARGEKLGIIKASGPVSVR